MRGWKLFVSLGIYLACTCRVMAQSPRNSPEAVVGIMQEMTVLHDAKTWVVMLKGQSGHYMIFRFDSKDTKQTLPDSGLTVSLTFAADNPSLVTKVTSLAEPQKAASSIGPRIIHAKMVKVDVDKGQFFYERPNGLVQVGKYDKKLKATAGRVIQNLEDVREGTPILLIKSESEPGEIADIVMLPPEQKTGLFDKVDSMAKEPQLFLQDSSSFQFPPTAWMIQDAKGTKLSYRDLYAGTAVMLNLTDDRKTVTAVAVPYVFESGLFKNLTTKVGVTHIILQDNRSFALAKDVKISGKDTKAPRDLQPGTKISLFLTADEKAVIFIGASATPSKIKLGK